MRLQMRLWRHLRGFVHHCLCKLHQKSPKVVQELLNKKIDAALRSRRPKHWTVQLPTIGCGLGRPNVNEGLQRSCSYAVWSPEPRHLLKWAIGIRSAFTKYIPRPTLYCTCVSSFVLLFVAVIFVVFVVLYVSFLDKDLKPKLFFFFFFLAAGLKGLDSLWVFFIITMVTITVSARYSAIYKTE